MTTIHHAIHLLAPMAHGDPGAETGNVTRHRRIPIVGPDGYPLPIPALSAGALRGVVRRALWREVFDTVELSREDLPAPQWDRLYAALANGGHIEKAQTTIRPDEIRARRAALPVLSLLGAALYGSHMAGRAKVTNAWLDCRETTAANVPGCESDTPMGALMADESRVRHIDREEQDSEVSGVTPMPTTVETVVCGARFVGRCTVPAPLEASAWAHGLDLVTHMGGKSGQGFGEVRITHDGDGSTYLAWLAEHTDDLRVYLVSLASELAKGAKKAKKPKAKPGPAPKPTEPTEDDDSAQARIF